GKGDFIPKFDVSSAQSVFSTLARLSEQSGARIFPISGTLLGLVREGKLLDHDYDLDFGIMSDDQEAYWALIERLQRHPDVAYLRYYWPSPLAAYMNCELRSATTIPMKTALRFRNGITVDLGSHFLYQGCRYHG